MRAFSELSELTASIAADSSGYTSLSSSLSSDRLSANLTETCQHSPLLLSAASFAAVASAALAAKVSVMCPGS